MDECTKVAAAKKKQLLKEKNCTIHVSALPSLNVAYKFAKYPERCNAIGLMKLRNIWNKFVNGKLYIFINVGMFINIKNVMFTNFNICPTVHIAHHIILK